VPLTATPTPRQRIAELHRQTVETHLPERADPYPPRPTLGKPTPPATSHAPTQPPPTPLRPATARGVGRPATVSRPPGHSGRILGQLRRTAAASRRGEQRGEPARSRRRRRMECASLLPTPWQRRRSPRPAPSRQATPRGGARAVALGRMPPPAHGPHAPRCRQAELRGAARPDRRDSVAGRIGGLAPSPRPPRSRRT